MDLSCIDVEAFLSELGLRNIRVDGPEVHFSCPFPGHRNGDANPSSSMQQGSTQVHCFGCGFNGNAISFLAALESVSVLTSLQWIRERFGDAFVEPEDLLSEIEEILAGTPMAKQKPKQILSEEEITKRYIDWHLVSMAHDGSHHYLIKRGFSADTLAEWQIGYDSISGRLSIPVRDEHGNLVGFKARLPFEPEDKRPRYKHLGGPEYGFETYQAADYIFGLHRIAGNKTLESLCIVLCEGELNALACADKGIVNSVGISGKYLSDTQAQLIARYCDTVVLIFDERKDALKAARKLEPLIHVRIAPEHDKDPAEMSEKELWELIDKSESSILI